MLLFFQIMQCPHSMLSSTYIGRLRRRRYYIDKPMREEKPLSEAIQGKGLIAYWYNRWRGILNYLNYILSSYWENYTIQFKWDRVCFITYSKTSHLRAIRSRTQWLYIMTSITLICKSHGHCVGDERDFYCVISKEFI